jgi:hypothetical protein
MDRVQREKRLPLDPEPLSLGRRATYRRILALLGSQPRPFVVGGAIGLSLQLGRLIDGQLELFMRAEDVPEALDAVTATGLKIERDDPHGKARITYGEHRVVVRWALPTPLFGEVDDAWLARSRRTRFLGIRVRVAPIEELLWLRMAIPSAASVSDPLIPQVFLARGATLDWPHLLSRMGGLEALLLAHLFLFWHQYPESARAVIPTWVITALRAQIDDGAERSLVSSSLLDPRRVEEGLAEQSLHGGG